LDAVPLQAEIEHDLEIQECLTVILPIKTNVTSWKLGAAQ